MEDILREVQVVVEVVKHMVVVEVGEVVRAGVEDR